MIRSAVTNRSELLTLLSEACELEHGLACCYLYAAFSLKQEVTEGGISWEQQQKVRLWASQIFHVAAEEMFHLSQAWNLLSAIGGTPWYGRPNFPQPSDYYPLHLPLETRPFSLETLERFIAFEHPSDPDAPPIPLELGDDAPDFRTVGELYGLIAEGIRTIPEKELFVGVPENQVGRELVDFPNLTRVTNRVSAQHAIDMILEQGEGCPAGREDSHYETFRKIRKSYLHELLVAEERGVEFSPVRPCISNPIAFKRPSNGTIGASLITDPVTAEIADLFDSIYAFMLRLLQYVFDNATDSEAPLLRTFATAAIGLMAAVVKPLGEALARLPAGPRQYGNSTAGAPFTLGRQVPLPHSMEAAQTIAKEKLLQLKARLNDVSNHPNLPPQVERAAANLGRFEF